MAIEQLVRKTRIARASLSSRKQQDVLASPIYVPYISIYLNKIFIESGDFYKCMRNYMTEELRVFN